MSWFCETEEAKKQLDLCEKNNCSDCEKCIWIKESAAVMESYSNVMNSVIPIRPKKLIKHKQTKWDKVAKDLTKKSNPNNHPLYDLIMEKFKGKEIK